MLAERQVICYMDVTGAFLCLEKPDSPSFHRPCPQRKSVFFISYLVALCSQVERNLDDGNAISLAASMIVPFLMAQLSLVL